MTLTTKYFASNHLVCCLLGVGLHGLVTPEIASEGYDRIFGMDIVDEHIYIESCHVLQAQWALVATTKLLFLYYSLTTTYGKQHPSQQQLFTCSTDFTYVHVQGQRRYMQGGMNEEKMEYVEECLKQLDSIIRCNVILLDLNKDPNLDESLQKVQDRLQTFIVHILSNFPGLDDAQKDEIAKKTFGPPPDEEKNKDGESKSTM